MRPISIYIHIPFCQHKCIYCDFYSVTEISFIKYYIESVIKEIEFFAEQYENEYEVKSVFFGGGTPSFLNAVDLIKILATLNRKFNISQQSEITIEANPGTIDIEKISIYKSEGINRISFGVQSFNDFELKSLSRIHNSQMAVDSVERAYKEGIKNISIDLIFSLPEQKKTDWMNSLRKSVQLPITHISAYSLILEEGTPLFEKIKLGDIKLNSQDEEAELYLSTIEFLSEKGFNQYEVSNFAKKGFESVHNKCYWEYGEYIGFGPSAHSFIDGKRFSNVSDIKKYIEFINQSRSAVCDSEVLTDEQKANEFVMLSLRSKGLDLGRLQKQYDKEWYNRNNKIIEKMISGGFIKMENNILRMTSSGYSILNEILLKFN